MNRPVIAVDVDGTLLIAREIPAEDDAEPTFSVGLNWDLAIFLIALRRLDMADIVLWSGGGADYAESVARKTGLTSLFDRYALKGTLHADIAIDDQKTQLASVDLQLAGPEGLPWMGLAL